MALHNCFYDHFPNLKRESKDGIALAVLRISFT